VAVEQATRDELTTLGAVETVEGQVALVLAQQLDDPRAGMAVSGDAKTLTALMAEIRDRAPAKKADGIDELNARRQARESTSEAV
jgi:hypothetical protein